MAGAGALWHATAGLRLGGALAFFDSDTYNDGKPGVAPVPLAAYEFRRVTLNAMYIPRVRELNDIAPLGAWLTFWLR